MCKNIFFSFFLLTVFFITEAYAKGPLYASPNKQNPLPIFLYQGKEISKLPACEKLQCEAAMLVSKGLPPDINSKKTPFPSGSINPATVLCSKVNGTVKSAYNAQGDAVTLCLFKDQSFIRAWDL